MTWAPVTWQRALRALAMACGLVLLLTFVAANFVLVDVRLWGLNVETRLAWAVVVAGGLGFAAGLLYSRQVQATPRAGCVGTSSLRTPPPHRRRRSTGARRHRPGRRQGVDRRLVEVEMRADELR